MATSAQHRSMSLNRITSHSRQSATFGGAASSSSELKNGGGAATEFDNPSPNPNNTRNSEYYRSLRRRSGDMPSHHLRNGSQYGTIRSLGHEFVGDKCKRGNEKPVVFKPSGVMVKCVVITLDGKDLHLEIDKDSLGQQLFDKICEHMDLCEDERVYFGIIRRDKMRTWYWLALDKKISKQIKKEKWQFEVQVKFYPYEVEALTESLTRYYLCLQVRQNLLNGSLRCTFPTYVILGAYVVQSEAGDHCAERHQGIEYIKNQLFAPKEKQTAEMLEKIVELHKQLRGQCVEEADLNFLNNAKKLALYGVDFHKVYTENSQPGGEMQIGVYYGGVLLYRNFLRLKRMSWARLIKVSYQQKEFMMVVRPPEEGHPEKELRFKCDSKELSKRLYCACVDHHRFFRLREQHLARRPMIVPAFASRTYIRPVSMPYSMSTDAGVNHSLLADDAVNIRVRVGRPQPVIKRAPTNIIPPPPKAPSSIAISASQHNGVTSASIMSGLSGDVVDLGVRMPRPQMQPLGLRLHLPDSTRGLGLHEAGLDAASRTGSGWQGIRSNQGVKEGSQYYWEARVLEEGPVMIGWSTNEANLEPVGSDSLGWALGLMPGEGKQFRRCNLLHDNQRVPLFQHALESGKKAQTESVDSEGNSSPPAPQPLLLQVNDVVGCLLTFTTEVGERTMLLQWTINGKPALPLSRLLSVPPEVYGLALFPSISMFDSRIEVNFGATSFAFPPPSSSWPELAPVPIPFSGKEGDGKASPVLSPPIMPLYEAPKENVVANRNSGWCINPNDTTAMIGVPGVAPSVLVSPDKKMIQTADSNDEWQGCRANKGVFGGGKFYYEVTILESGPHAWARLGWSTENGRLNLGSDQWGYGYGADKDGFGINGHQGKRLHCDEINNYGEALTGNDVVGCFLDLSMGSIRWSKNGKEFPEAYQIPGDILRTAAFFPTASLKCNTLLFNFGEIPFKFPPKDRTFLHLAYAPSGNVIHNPKIDPTRYSSRGGVWGYSWSSMPNVTHVATPKLAIVEDDFLLSAYEPYCDRLSITSTFREGQELSATGRFGLSEGPSTTSTLNRTAPQSPSTQHSYVRRGDTLPTANNNDSAPVCTVRNSKTVSGGQFMRVETPESEVDTQYYYDDDGNYVKRTTRKTVKRVTTTNFVTEHSENQLHMNSANSFHKYPLGSDKELDGAIRHVTQKRAPIPQEPVIESDI